MVLVLAIIGTAAAAAVAAYLLARRRSVASPGHVPAHAAEGAWVSRITQSIPMVARRLAEEAAATPADGRGGLGLQGNLAQTPLHDLLQYLALGRKSGILELACGRRTGRIVLCQGRIGKSAYRGKDGMEAAFLMMDLTEGDFEFYESPQQAEASVPAPLEVVDVIMVWMSRKPRKKQASSG